MPGIRQAVGDGLLVPRGGGFGTRLGDAAAVQSAASLAATLFGIRRAPEIARLAANTDAGTADLKVARRKGEQYKLGHLSHLLKVQYWGGACPVLSL